MKRQLVALSLAAGLVLGGVACTDDDPSGETGDVAPVTTEDQSGSLGGDNEDEGTSGTSAPRSTAEGMEDTEFPEHTDTDPIFEGTPNPR